MIWDTHIHSDFSHDGKTSMEEMVGAAKKKKLSGICFTEHLDVRISEKGAVFPLDLDGYLKKCREYSKKKDFSVCTGIEFSIKCATNSYLEQIASTNDFDFIIGSYHDKPKIRWDGIGTDTCEAEKEMYTRYFLDMFDAVKKVKCFDVCGHIDYVVRYGPNKNKYYTYEKYADIIDEILRTLIYNGKGIEINTSGFRYGLGQSHPTEKIIKRYRELGGEIITIGSDGHAPGEIAYAFEKVPAILKSAGFQYFTVFKKRKPEFISL